MATFSLKKRFSFEAAHYLPHHEGKCRRMHGHSWVGWVEVVGSELHADGPETGMLTDYGRLSAALHPIIEEHLDHYLLNDSLPLESPTSEEVARWVFNRLRCRGVTIAAVTIEETCTSACTYRD